MDAQSLIHAAFGRARRHAPRRALRGRRGAAGLAIGALVLTGLVFSSLGVITGIWAETFDQHSIVAGVVVAPLALLAGVFYSARTLPEPWETLTRLNPIYYVVDATRGGFAGFHEPPLWASLAITAVVALGAFLLAAALLARGWRLKR